MLVAVALAGCIAVLALLRMLAQQPALDIATSVDAQGRIVLGASNEPLLQPLADRVLLSVAIPGATPVPVDAALMHRVPRWQPHDGRRERSLEQHQALAAALASGSVALYVDGDPPVVVPTRPRGLGGLGLMVWPFAALMLLLPLFGCVAVLARPATTTALFLLVCVAQALGMAFIAAASLRGLGQPIELLRLEGPVRLALDAVAAAAAVQALAHGLSRGGIAALWMGTALWVASAAGGWLSPSWVWGQLLCSLLAGLALWASWPQPGGAPDPRRHVAGRLTATALIAWLLVNAVVLVGSGQPPLAHALAAGASVAWSLFIVSLLMLMPFLARSRRLLRELALLAGISTMAAALDLLFVAVFAVDASASLAVAVFLALAVYAFARQRLLDQLLGTRMPSTDRIFELLYRAARDVQRRPERQQQRLAQLLHELFEPLEMTRTSPVPRHSMVLDGGAALVVPLRADSEGRPGLALRLRLASRGQRLFAPEDARLADRLVEQLRRAVAYDRAVEQGRHEERQRLAQDLHDDIGARLLTLMYQAPTPELEDYIRHTLQDLKTLTRGLAVGEHRLGPAAAEWKRDLSQRLGSAQAELGWSCQVDEALTLTVVQWSALTRVLRELVSNALFHGHATRVDVALELDGDALTLSVADDGEGRDPAAWAHGLGMGGVRKRVKQLGGVVDWRENGDRGIACTVRIDHFRDSA